jgi:phospholipase/carboxylesterase
VFDTVHVDPARIAIGGFSDGATYALSLGLLNGDLFRRIAAFSPGFVVSGTPHGTPRIFISHGNADPILPIDRCSRRIVADLRKRGYDVTFREFAGGHEIPADIARAGLSWVAKPSISAAIGEDGGWALRNRGSKIFLQADSGSVVYIAESPTCSPGADSS